MNTNINYYNKYLKYKNKYIELRSIYLKLFDRVGFVNKSHTSNKNKFLNLRKQIEEFNIINENKNLKQLGGCKDETKEIIKKLLLTDEELIQIKNNIIIQGKKIIILHNNLFFEGYFIKNNVKDIDEYTMYEIRDNNEIKPFVKIFTLDEICNKYESTDDPTFADKKAKFIKKLMEEQEKRKLFDNFKNHIEKHRNRRANKNTPDNSTIMQVSQIFYNSLKFLSNIGDNIILVDALNVIRNTSICYKIITKMKKDNYSNADKYEKMIDEMKEYGYLSLPSKEKKDEYRKITGILLFDFMPYILYYMGLENPGYKFIICEMNTDNKQSIVKFHKHSSYDWYFITLPEVKELDDLLLLVLYSYFKNIKKIKNIYIFSSDQYGWWSRTRLHYDYNYDYTLTYLSE